MTDATGENYAAVVKYNLGQINAANMTDAEINALKTDTETSYLAANAAITADQIKRLRVYNEVVRLRIRSVGDLFVEIGFELSVNIDDVVAPSLPTLTSITVNGVDIAVTVPAGAVTTFPRSTLATTITTTTELPAGDDSDSSSANSDSADGGVIAGAVIGVLFAIVLVAVIAVYIQRRKSASKERPRSAAENPVYDASQIEASPQAESSGEETEEKFVFDRKSNSIRLTSVRKAASDGDVLNPTAEPLLNPPEPLAVAELTVAEL